MLDGDVLVANSGRKQASKEVIYTSRKTRNFFPCVSEDYALMQMLNYIRDEKNSLNEVCDGSNLFLR